MRAARAVTGQHQEAAAAALGRPGRNPDMLGGPKLTTH
jgi:hypothetical protein